MGKQIRMFKMGAANSDRPTTLTHSEALLLLWVNVVGLSEFAAPILNILICFPINFLINRFWTFR